MAGDIDTYGDRSKIRIIRETNRSTQVKFFDVRSVDIIHSEFYYVEPNDVIYIQDMNEQFFQCNILCFTTINCICHSFFWNFYLWFGPLID
jgi:polysaccharide export outer membrane protein